MYKCVNANANQRPKESSKKQLHSDREVFLREIQFDPYIYNYILRVFSPVTRELYEERSFQTNHHEKKVCVGSKQNKHN